MIMMTKFYDEDKKEDDTNTKYDKRETYEENMMIVKKQTKMDRVY